MKIQSLLNNMLKFWFVLIAFFLLPVYCTDTWGASYVAAVGSDGTNRYLKIARISNIGSVPSVEQIEFNISTDFLTNVYDVAFLNTPGCCVLRLAVLGDCTHLTLNEFSLCNGDTHRIEGTIIIYDIVPSGALEIKKLKKVSYSEWFDTTWGTGEGSYIHNEMHRIAGLA